MCENIEAQNFADEDTKASREIIRDEAYQDFCHGLHMKVHELFMYLNNEFSMHDPMSREWQELYTVSRMLNLASDTLVLAGDRSRKYARAPF